MSTRSRGKRFVLWTLGSLLAIQVVPYGWSHTNPPIVQEPKWDSAETRELVKGACFDCHSNETRWPPYAFVAPGSWLLAYDVGAGRNHLNFSEWQKRQQHAKDAVDNVRKSDMPPVYYGWMHPPARLSDADRERLAIGLEKTLGTGAAMPMGKD